MSDEYYEFDCASCDQRTTVNTAMRREILDEGCLVCDSPTDPSDFTPIP